MKRHKALHILSHEHHHGLLLAQLIKTDSPEYKNLPKSIIEKKDYTLKSFEEKLIPHFKKEEEILFPFAHNKNSEIDNLIDDLIKQHKIIYSLIEKLKSSDQPELELNELGELLEIHIRTEERDLFPRVQEFLNEDELLKLESELKNNL